MKKVKMKRLIAELVLIPTSEQKYTFDIKEEYVAEDDIYEEPEIFQWDIEKNGIDVYELGRYKIGADCYVPIDISDEQLAHIKIGFKYAFKDYIEREIAWLRAAANKIFGNDQSLITAKEIEE